MCVTQQVWPPGPHLPGLPTAQEHQGLWQVVSRMLVSVRIESEGGRSLQCSLPGLCAGGCPGLAVAASEEARGVAGAAAPVGTLSCTPSRPVGAQTGTFRKRVHATRQRPPAPGAGHFPPPPTGDPGVVRDLRAGGCCAHCTAAWGVCTGVRALRPVTLSFLSIFKVHCFLK